MDLDAIRHDYQKALRAWHFAWTEREIAHRDTTPSVCMSLRPPLYSRCS
jgi:hypothetical protein